MPGSVAHTKEQSDLHQENSQITLKGLKIIRKSRKYVNQGLNEKANLCAYGRVPIFQGKV